MKKKIRLTEDEKFESELFHSLKSYGYLFPDSIKEVGRFEELYGSTEIDTPSSIKLPDNSITESVYRSIKDIGFPPFQSVAAFTSKKNLLLDFSDKMLNKKPEKGRKRNKKN